MELLYSTLPHMISVLVACLIATYYYRFFSINKGIIANPNTRTLHKLPVPRGGGIIFSVVYFVAIIFLWYQKLINFELFMVIGMGGIVASIFGFIDDILDINPFLKLVFQSGLALWILIWFDGGILSRQDFFSPWISWVVSWILLVWMINLYNFMDGVDGMAASGAVFISSSLAFTIIISNGFSVLAILLILLSLCCIGFLIYNWPPASIFMGDSGSIFLGYIFGSLIINSTMNGTISIWTWIVVFGYFISDTSTTIILRLFNVKKWYKAHRSHAYQNLARKFGSHLKIICIVQIYNVLFLFPLTIWTVLIPDWGPIAASLAILPIVLLTFLFGPIYSSD